uniref:Leucine-rich repeat-containing protein 27 n=1 Tax=Lygus hesperus TaxID=30085 RepID=A0A0A9WWA5_LYGHE
MEQLINSIKDRERSCMHDGGSEGSLWVPGERELCYNLPTDDPVTGYVDGCSMFIDLSYRRLRHLNLNLYFKTSYLSVSHLYLQHNKLAELPDDVFIELRNLMYLDARNNNLISFPKTVEGHEGLQTILLQDNLIEYFPIELGSLEGLKTLGIEFNPMRFPSHTVLSQWRNKNEVVDFFRRCWEAKSTNVPAVVRKKVKKIFKPKKPKFIKVKDHSEIVYKLQRSPNLKKQKEGEKIKEQQQQIQKELQRVKDKDVLEAWQDKYRAYKNEERFVILHPPPYGVDERYNRITTKLDALKIDSQKKKGLKYRLNLDEEISGIKERLASIGKETHYKDPETEMTARLREIKTIRKLQKKIEHLKHRS